MIARASARRVRASCPLTRLSVYEGDGFVVSCARERGARVQLASAAMSAYRSVAASQARIIFAGATGTTGLSRFILFEEYSFARHYLSMLEIRLNLLPPLDIHLHLLSREIPNVVT